MEREALVEAMPELSPLEWISLIKEVEQGNI
jgi:hypothetical protein